MRIILTLFSIFLFWACNNQVSSIGEDLVDDNSSVQIESYDITTTSTVRLDSFPTSAGNTSATIKNLLIGQTNDPVTGLTVATPYFEIVPIGGTKITNNTYVYDSVTFNFSYTGKVWGDTNSIQTFRLYQLNDLPVLDKETDLIYNTAKVSYDASKPFGVLRFWPLQEKKNKFQFRIDNELGLYLYNMVRISAPEIKDQLDFIKFFKGMTIVPDPANTCLMAIHSVSDSLTIRLHFHDQNNNYTYNFGKSSSYNKYTFLNTENNATGTPYAVLTGQQQKLPFREAKRPNAPNGQAVTQGLDGYMMKMQLPIAPAGDKYRTIVKAEIVIYTQQGILKNFPLPETICLYKSDVSNNIRDIVTDAAGNIVEGKFVTDPQKPEDDKFVLNITDFYNTLSQQANANEHNYILVSIPEEYMGTTFDRLTTDDWPVLNVYYANYE